MPNFVGMEIVERSFFYVNLNELTHANSFCVL